MGVPPLSIFCIIFQTKHLPADRFCKILKTKEIICKIFKTLELWFLWSFAEDTSLRLVDSVSTLHLILSAARSDGCDLDHVPCAVAPNRGFGVVEGWATRRERTPGVKTPLSSVA